jgi:hypothetical protein
VTGNGSTYGHAARPGSAAATGGAQWADVGRTSGNFAQGHRTAERGKRPAAFAAAQAEKPASKWGDFDDVETENEAPQQRRNIQQQARCGSWTKDLAVICEEDEHRFATVLN